MPEKKNEKDRSIDELLREAEDRIGALESGKLSLEEAFAAYREGTELLKQSSKKIDRVEKQVMQLMEDGSLRPFEEGTHEEEENGEEDEY